MLGGPPWEALASLSLGIKLGCLMLEYRKWLRRRPCGCRGASGGGIYRLTPLLPAPLTRMGRYGPERLDNLCLYFQCFCLYLLFCYIFVCCCVVDFRALGIFGRQEGLEASGGVFGTCDESQCYCYSFEDPPFSKLPFLTYWR